MTDKEKIVKITTIEKKMYMTIIGKDISMKEQSEEAILLAQLL